MEIFGPQPFWPAIYGLYLWAALAFVSGFIARSKKRDPGLYFLITLIASPLVGLPLIIGLTDRRSA
jgi:hypothetical protein